MIDNKDKIKGILQSNSLDELPLKYLPPVSDTPDNYYFISYSHLDYKYVYKDIFALQSQGVNVWYDRGMPAGISWKETAEKYIRPSRCAGVVFYVSENSLLSPAIHEEIAFAKKCGKSCLTINIPLEENSKSVSAKEMLDELITQGKDISAEKYDFICESFNTEVLYIDYSAQVDFKAEKICSLKKPPLLEIDNEYSLTVVSVNDTDVTTVQESDFAFRGSDGETVTACQIGNCAFANCALLNSIELPKTVEVVSDYAFYNCRSLKSIDLSSVVFFGDSVFADCSALKEIIFGENHNQRVFGERMFYHCSSLEKLDIPKSIRKIGSYTFASSGLKEITIPQYVSDIDPRAFNDCQNLTKITVDENNVKYFCLYNCLVDMQTKTLICALSNSVLPNDGSIVTIDSNAFSCAKEFSMSTYYQYCGDNHYYHHAEYGKIDILDLRLPDNSVIIPQGVQVLKSQTFNARMQGIVLPDSIKEIWKYAFVGCENLEYIFFMGTIAQWKNIKKETEWLYRSSLELIICLDGEIELG